MARVKKNRRPSERQSGFYESLPTAVMPPVMVPGLREHLDESLAAAKDWARNWLIRLRSCYKLAVGIKTSLLNQETLRRLPGQAERAAMRAAKALLVQIQALAAWIGPRLWLAGMATTNLILHTVRMLHYAVVMSSQSIRGYAPPVAADAHVYGLRAGQALTGRKARGVYFSVSARSCLKATALKPLRQYSSMNFQPASKTLLWQPKTRAFIPTPASH
jgi:hypothetical protein